MLSSSKKALLMNRKSRKCASWNLKMRCRRHFPRTWLRKICQVCRPPHPPHLPGRRLQITRSGESSEEVHLNCIFLGSHESFLLFAFLFLCVVFLIYVLKEPKFSLLCNSIRIANLQYNLLSYLAYEIV
jgi:hypothetical protein